MVPGSCFPQIHTAIITKERQVGMGSRWRPDATSEESLATASPASIQFKSRKLGGSGLSSATQPTRRAGSECGTVCCASGETGSLSSWPTSLKPLPAVC